MSEFLNNTGLEHLIEKIKANYLSTSTITTIIGGKANSAHTHGNITSAGTITTNVAIANGDRLVFSDSSSSNKLVRHSLTFNGSTTTKALTQKGTFENVVNTVNGQSGAVTITIPEDITNAEIDAIWDGIMAGVITFTISGATYQADAGMTWEQWVNSGYNVVANPYTGQGSVNNGNFYIEYDKIRLKIGYMINPRVCNPGSSTNEVSPQDIINANYAYELTSADEPAD